MYKNKMNESMSIDITFSFIHRVLIPFCPAVATQATETSVPACLAVQACLVEWKVD